MPDRNFKWKCFQDLAEELYQDNQQNSPGLFLSLVSTFLFPVRRYVNVAFHAIYLVPTGIEVNIKITIDVTPANCNETNFRNRR